MTGTLGWLIFATTRNQVRARLARLRNPRYAVAMLLGLGYLWAVYLRPDAGRTAGFAMDGVIGTTIVPFVTLLFVAWTWLFGADRSALAFSEAEVTMLFTAPVTRRTLVLYKLARTQVAIVGTSIVWTLVFRQGPTIALALTHVIGYWVLLSTMNLNRLGVALVRTSHQAHGLRGIGRNWIAIAIVLAASFAIAADLTAAWPTVAAAGEAREALEAVGRALATGPASWVLLPFRLASAPLREPPGASWLLAMGPALLLLGLLGAWVLRTDAAFEEAAAEATAARARQLDALRARRGVSMAAVTSVSRTIPLASVGAPAVALLWKNAMWLLRARQLRGLAGPGVAGALALAVVGTRQPEAATIIGIVCALLAAAMLVFGPLSMRNDLRSELLHLSVLKTYPLRGRDVVLAEVASGALPMAAMQYLLLLVSITSLGLGTLRGIEPAMRVAAAVAAPLLLVGLNGAAFTIHNGVALLFPGWARLGPAAGSGVETLGLGMINLFFSGVVFVLLLALPLLAGIAVVALLREQLVAGVLLGASLAGALLLAEVVLCAAPLGRALDRIEPMAVAG